jgi:hypothetical protein
MTKKAEDLEKKPATDGAEAAPVRRLTSEAQRALAEAEERRRRRDKDAQTRPLELNGRGGLDPVRYGDWEVKVIISDF